MFPYEIIIDFICPSFFVRIIIKEKKFWIYNITDKILQKSNVNTNLNFNFRQSDFAGKNFAVYFHT